MDLPKWDYFLDRNNQPIAIMRGTQATQTMLFAREVLGKELDPETDERLIKDIAEKGCEPTYRTLWGMHHQDKATGWHFDKATSNFFDITTRHWPDYSESYKSQSDPGYGSRAWFPGIGT